MGLSCMLIAGLPLVSLTGIDGDLMSRMCSASIDPERSSIIIPAIEGPAMS